MVKGLTIMVPVGLMGEDVSKTWQQIKIDDAASLRDLITKISGQLTQPGYTLQEILSDEYERNMQTALVLRRTGLPYDTRKEILDKTTELRPGYKLIVQVLGPLTEHNFHELPDDSTVLLVPLPRAVVPNIGQARAAEAAAGAAARGTSLRPGHRQWEFA